MVVAISVLPLLSAAAADPWLILNPYSGAPGSMLGVSGFGFGAREDVAVRFLDQSVESQTDASGNFSAPSLPVPWEPAGNYSVTAQGDESRRQASANFYISGFYPRATPSSWYLLPGERLGFSGSNFAPNEAITIRGPEIAHALTANGSGNFSAADALAIPFGWQNSTRAFTVDSTKSAYDIPLVITIGTFYPQIDPSAYFIAKNQPMSAAGSGFAPNEEVELQISGAATMRRTADGSGNVHFSFTAPGTGTDFTLTARGLSSNQSSTRTITLMQ